MNIRPGTSTRVVTEIDPANDKIRVGSSLVYDARGSTIILAQTDPPVPKSMLGGQVIVTYLVKEKGDLVRHGFPARVCEFVDYDLNSGQFAKAIAVEKTGEPSPYSIRMFYRVTPSEKNRLTMSILGKRVNIVDISLGGARINYSKPVALHPDTVFPVRLEIDGRFYDLDARVLRVWFVEGHTVGRLHHFASIEFAEIDKNLETALSRKIHDIERLAIAEEGLH
jgi:hypothetical protein